MQQDSLSFSRTPSSPPAQNVFSVTELSLLLKRSIEQTFLNVRIKGEVSSYKRHTSGHQYFTLKDDQSVINAICWRGTPLSIQLSEGLEIVAKGRLTTYPARSNYQIIVESAEIAGEGALLKLLEERKRKLHQEGLFAVERKKKIPAFPQRIGVVTSPTGAVIRDILHRLKERYPCEVLLWPVLVQGPGAENQIAEAINGFNALSKKDRPDTLIVARGGGSLEDLWCFNEEIVARAVAECDIPLISAVGHETDTTLIDYVSDLRAPTPTGAAEVATPVLTDVLLSLGQSQQRLSLAMNKRIQHEDAVLKGLARGLPTPSQILDDKQQRLFDWSDRFDQAFDSYIGRLKQSFDHIGTRLKAPLDKIEQGDQEVRLQSIQLQQAIEMYIKERSQKLDLLKVGLEQSSYQKILEKGFCYASAKQSPLTSQKDMSKHFEAGESANLTFHDGTIDIKGV